MGIYFVGGAAAGVPGEVHPAPLNPVGTECLGSDGCTYKYLAGAAGMLSGAWVGYDHQGRTAGLATAMPLLGMNAVATGDTVDGTWGWYAVDGVLRARAATAAAHTPVFATAEPGIAADAGTAQVLPAIWRSGVTDGQALVELHRPFCGGLTYVAPPPPVLTALEPATAIVGTPSFTLHVQGTGFAQGAVIVFNGYDEPTTVVSPEEVTTGVNMAVWAGPSEPLPVAVRNPDGGVSPALPFTFTAAVEG